MLSLGWQTVLGGFLIHLVLGTLYLWANITSSVTSYLRQYNPNIDYNDTIMVYASALAAQGSTMLLGGLISQKIGARKCCLLGSIVLVAGTFLASCSKTVMEMILCQGVLLGFGLGLCYTAPISAAVRWMPQQKGLVTGIIVGGFGCGAFVFGFVATLAVNPTHISVNQTGPDKNYYSSNSPIIQRVPFMFRMLGIAYTFVLLLGVYFLKEPNATYSQHREEDVLPSSSSISTSSNI
jgi:MFS family permease